MVHIRPHSCFLTRRQERLTEALCCSVIVKPYMVRMHLKAYAASVHHNTYIVGEEVSHEQLYYKYKHCHRVSHIGLEAF